MEYKLVPSPIRADYLKSQRLNPAALLPYIKKAYAVVNLAGSSLNNDITEFSLFDFFTNAADYNVFGGVSYLQNATSARSKLIFPPNYFVPGNTIHIKGHAQILDNIAGATLTVRSYCLQTDPGVGAALSAVNRISFTTDANVAADDLNSGVDQSYGFIFEVTQHVQFSVSDNVARMFHSARISYKNENSIEQITFDQADSGLPSNNPDLTSPTVINITVQWNTADVSNLLQWSILNVDILQ